MMGYVDFFIDDKGARIEIQDLQTSAAQPPTTSIQKKRCYFKKKPNSKKTHQIWGKKPIFFAPAARIFLAACGGQNH